MQFNNQLCNSLNWNYWEWSHVFYEFLAEHPTWKNGRDLADNDSKLISKSSSTGTDFLEEYFFILKNSLLFLQEFIGSRWKLTFFFGVIFFLQPIWLYWQVLRLDLLEDSLREDGFCTCSSFTADVVFFPPKPNIPFILKLFLGTFLLLWAESMRPVGFLWSFHLLMYFLKTLRTWQQQIC